MHDRSHHVIKFSTYFPNQQRITFVLSYEKEASVTECRNKTMLGSCFLLNEANLEARRFLYVDVPYHYDYQSNYWKTHIKGEDKVVSIMCTMYVKR